MPYCSHCGTQVKPGARFCSNCGKPLGEAAPDRSIRMEVYQGEVRKCPACGAEVPSLTAICPDCGHEFNSIETSSAIRDFSEKLSQYDAEIASSPTEKTGWSTWSTGSKVGWVFLNYIFICIPILIRSLTKKKFEPNASSQAKAAFIENYVFPNERATILEALLFIKSQMTNLVNRFSEPSAAYWIDVWYHKASQLYQRAEVIMPGDSMAKQTYADIHSLNQKFSTNASNKKITTIVIVIAVFLILYMIGHSR